MADDLLLQNQPRRQVETSKSFDSKNVKYPIPLSLLKNIGTILENTTDVLILFDRDWHFLYVNHRAEEILQKRKKEVIGKSLWKVFPDVANSPAYKKYMEDITVGKSINFETFLPSLEKWFEVHVYPSEDGYLLYMENINERKRAQDALLRLASIVENTDDAVFSKTLNAEITSWNKGAERLYGYRAKEMIGKSIKIIIPPDKSSEFDEIMRKLRKGESLDHFETIRRKKDGSLVDVSLTISPIRNSNGKIIGASTIGRDITERKKLEVRKDDFISIASHELKTPITSIKVFIDVLIKMMKGKKEKDALRYLARMNKQTDKLTGLVSDLLDVSKIHAGKLEFRKEVFSFQRLVKETIENIQATTDKKVLLRGTVRRKIYGDYDRISQVLINILTNAIKYSPRSKKIIVTTESKNNEVIVCVKDYGVGISQENQKKIFERFFRVSDNHDKTFPGLGMGLYISSEIIRRHDGKMWVKSKTGKGSAFFFSLPIIGTKQVA